MAASRRAIFAEESAEVEVLLANLDKLTIISKKIQGSVNRLELSGQDLQKAMKPIHGSTKQLSQIHTSVDRVTAVVTKIQAPIEQRDQEESIIRSDPRTVGIHVYVDSLKRADQVARGLGASSLGSNHTTMKETAALVKYGIRQLEEIFKHTLLSTGAAGQLEPLSYIAKEKLFPIIPPEESQPLRIINAFMLEHSGVGGSTELYSTAKMFAEIRGTYVARSLTNMAQATLNTARARNPDGFYKKGDCSISSYKVACHGMLAAEYDNIRILFTPEECAKLMLATAMPALSEFGKTLSELNSMINLDLMRDCFLAYECMDIVTKLGGQLGDMAGPDIQRPIRETLRPIHNTAKLSIGKILEHTKNSVQRLATLPPDGAIVPAVVETVERLRCLTDFLAPVLKILSALGDGGWGPVPGSPNTLGGSPSMRSFDTTLTGTTAVGSKESRQIFIHFCADVVETLVQSLDSRCRLLHKSQGVQAIFMLNNVAVIDGMIRSHDALAQELLGPTALLPNGQGLQARMDMWRSKYQKLYLALWHQATGHLMDVVYTSRGSRRSAAAMNKDSEAIVGAMSSKERETMKQKFAAFNLAFEELAAKQKSYKMEREVKDSLAKEVSHMLEPLYGRFWDRYHEVDRKGKYVKYDKTTFAQALASLE